MCDCEDNQVEHEEALCGVCRCETGELDFEVIDDEFDPRQPMCPACQVAKRMHNQCCEYCDAPAEYETDSGFLCCDHHSDYVDGYIGRE